MLATTENLSNEIKIKVEKVAEEFQFSLLHILNNKIVNYV